MRSSTPRSTGWPPAWPDNVPGTGTVATFGVEEEYIFLDPATLRPVNVGDDVHRQLLSGAPRSKFVSHEFLASQIERSSPVFSSMEQAEADLLAFRSRLAVAAAERGVVAASVGAPFQTSGWPEVTDAERYHTVETEFRGLVTDHLINGLHIHTHVPSREAGVQALNRVRVWLPTLLALAGNSPFWHGADTGFASWRSVHMRRWSTIGCPPPFADEADYDRRIRRLVGVGGTYDIKTIWWNARLSEAHPTLEVRVCDAQLEVRQTMLLAALTRALVVTALSDADAGRAPIEIAPELLDAALWHAARDGAEAKLLHPATSTLEPAEVVVDALLRYLADALDDSGDTERMRALLAQARRAGSGARRQRSAVQEGGRPALRKLYTKTLTAHG
jgi:carboxylate-amine ligase